MCAPFQLGLSLCIELKDPSVDLVRHLFKGCPVITTLYLEQEIFKTPLSCFAIPLSKGDQPKPVMPDFQKRLVAFKDYVESK